MWSIINKFHSVVIIHMRLVSMQSKVYPPCTTHSPEVGRRLDTRYGCCGDLNHSLNSSRLLHTTQVVYPGQYTCRVCFIPGWTFKIMQPLRPMQVMLKRFQANNRTWSQHNLSTLPMACRCYGNIKYHVMHIPAMHVLLQCLQIQ